MVEASTLSLRIALLTLGILALLPSLASAQEEYRTHQLYGKLEAASREGGSSAVLDILQGPDMTQDKTWEDHSAALQWFKDKAWEQRDPNPFYSLFYSDLLFVAAKSLDESGRPNDAKGIYESSYLWLQVFECMALTDAARCNDPTATRSIAGLINQRFSYFPPLLTRLDPDLRHRAVKFALAHEEKLSNRPPSPVTCRSGVKAMDHAMSDPDRTETPEPSKDHVGGQRIAVRASTPFVPDYLPSSDWTARRTEIRSWIEKNRR